MKNFRKMLAITLVTVLAVLLMPVVNNWNVSATTEGWTAIGTCEWKIDNKVLTIRPQDGDESGTLPNGYDVITDWPWNGSRMTITEVVIEDGVISGNSTAWMFTNFSSATSFDLAGLDTSNAENMEQMFTGVKAEELDLSGFNTSKVTNMQYMFQSCASLKNIDMSGFNTSNVTDMSGMFFGCSNLKNLDLSNFDTSNVEYMNSMFQGMWMTFIDLSSFNTSNVKNMSNMFDMCTLLETIVVGSGWNTTNITESDSMFGGDYFPSAMHCAKLEGGAGTKFNAGNLKDKTYAHVDGGASNPGYLTSVDQYLADKTIYLKNGKAYSSHVDGSETYSNNITAAVASKGLTYQAATKDTSATWTMEDFVFTTSAATAIEFADDGTEESPLNINIKVIGTNNITSGDQSTGKKYGIKFSGSNVEYNIYGTGNNESYLNVTAGATSPEGLWNDSSYGIYTSGAGMTFKDLSACFAGSSARFISTGGSFNGKVIIDDGAKVASTGQSNSGLNMCTGISLLGPSFKINGNGELVAKCIGNSAKENYAIYSAFELEAKAVVTGTDTEVSWDKDGYAYKDSSVFATDVTLTAPTITVGEQTGTLTYGTDGTATYTVKVEGISEPEKFDVTWYDKDGTPLEYPLAGVTVSYDAQTDTLTVETEDITPVGTYMFTLTSGDVTSDKATLTVGQKELTVTGTTVADKVYDGTTETTVKAGTLTGMVEGQNVQIDTATAAFEDKDAGEDKNVTVKYTLKGDDAGNYTISDETITADITAKELTVTGTTVADKKYDGTKDATVTAGTLTGVVLGDTVSIKSATGTFDDANANKTNLVTVKYELEGTDSSNYTVADGKVSGDITRRSITLTSGSASKTEDSKPLTNNEISVSGDGFVTGEGFTYSVTGSQTKVGASKNTFTYTAKAGTDAANYDVTKVEGILTVTEKKIDVVKPTIIKGAGQTIDLGNAESAEFVSDASFDKFVKVTVDDKDVDVKYYTAVSGSTKITFTKEYLQTLSAGKHTIGVVSTTGTAEAEFTVKAAEKAPDTGDSSNVLLYSAVALFSLAGAVLLRKKKFSV